MAGPSNWRCTTWRAATSARFTAARRAGGSQIFTQDISNLPVSLYLVCLSTADTSLTERLVISR